MNCPFAAAFLLRLESYLLAASIDVDLIDRVQAWKEVDLVPPTSVRAAWACRAALETLLTQPIGLSPPPATQTCVLTDDFIARAHDLLQPLKKHLVVRSAEAQILSPRDHTQIETQGRRHNLLQLQRVERMLQHARSDPRKAGGHFYDFVYRFCQDTDATAAWFERLMEVQ